MRQSSLIATIAAFALAGAAAVSAAALMVGRIERTSQREIDTLFLEGGLDWASVSVDGLQVMLSGTAPDEATRFQALSLAGNVVDATRVIDGMEVTSPEPIRPPEFSIEILRNDEGVSLIGLVPDGMDREAVSDLLQEIAGRGEVTDLLESADYPVPDGWGPALTYSLDALARLPRSKISVSPGSVEITAISDSAEQKRALQDALNADLPAGVTLALDISAPRPVITPFTLRFLMDEEGGRFDACSAHTEDGRARILAAAAAAGLQGKATCTLGLGVPSPRWPDAVTAGIDAVARLGGGTLSFSDADVSLTAPVGTDQTTFDTVVGELEAALPEVFSLNAVLPAPLQIDGAGADAGELAPEFVATLSPEGLLQLRGRVNDARLREAVESFARARFSTAEVRGTMRTAEDLPVGWSGRVFSGLEALSNLTNGALVVQPENITIRGDTDDPDARAEIARILGDQLGAAANITINVTYHEVEEPEVTLPTPEECVDAINAILAARKITFAPGSAEIDSSARVSVDRIAEVMEDCTAVPMEIGGHTDSQGREAMNLGLSQRRAEAVLEALMARRVLTANLTARGYGEEQPIADNDSEEGREENRRIEFTLRLREDEVAEATAEEDPEAEAADAETEETPDAETAEAETPDEETPADEAAVDETETDEAVADDVEGDDAASDETASDADTTTEEPESDVDAEATTDEPATDEPAEEAAAEETDAEADAEAASDDAEIEIVPSPVDPDMPTTPPVRRPEDISE
ncbi:OmpA family protein [Psychromarinibacter sp. S121]|uniref:OmpA family protein n=1 Tax=Psychromarinibacter sp. S121 TaxID=3415127 RepID=UPI003C7A3A0B